MIGDALAVAALFFIGLTLLYIWTRTGKEK